MAAPISSPAPSTRATVRCTRTTRWSPVPSSSGPTTRSWRSTPGRATTPSASAGWPKPAWTASSPTDPTSPWPRWGVLEGGGKPSPLDLPPPEPNELCPRPPPGGTRQSPLRQDQVEHFGFVAELEHVGVAQVVAVDLIGDRAVGAHGERGQVGAVDDPAAAPQRLAVAQRRADDAEEPRERHGAHGDRRQPSVERGLGCEVERPVAQVRIGVGVEDDREVGIVDHRAVGVLHREARTAAVVMADPRVEPGVDEQRVTRIALELGPALYLLD